MQMTYVAVCNKDICPAELSIQKFSSNMFVIFQDPKPEDGGAYKCTANNEMGESNANITLNFAGLYSHHQGLFQSLIFLIRFQN